MLRSSPRARLAGFDRLEDRLTPAAGALDTVFSGDGLQTVNFGNTDTARGVAVQTDGKVVVAGSWDGGSAHFAIARFNTDGTLDTTFSGDGKANIDFGNEDFATAVAIQADGRIVVAGYTNAAGNDDFAVARLKTDGTLDTTFNGTGRATVAFNIGSGLNDRANAVAIQADGRIVFAGSVDRAAAGDIDFGVARLKTDGTPDTTFNGSGRAQVFFDIGGSKEDKAHAVAIQADGKIVIAGYAETASNNDFALARLKTDGTLDTTFDGDGRATTSFGNDDRINALAIQPDGRIVAAGSWDGGSSDFAVARYKTNGDLDDTFSTDGRANLTFGTPTHGEAEYATGVAVQANGAIVVGGYTDNNVSGGPNNFGVARLRADGTLDSSFDGDGKFQVDFGGDDRAYGLAIQPDGNVVVAGATAGNFAVARVETHPGAVVANFGNETYRWLDGSWQKLANTAAQELDIADDGTVFGVYGNGTWKWAPGAAGVLTTPGIAQQVELTDGGVAYGDFGGDGVFRHTDATGWVKISAQNPTMLDVSDDGSMYAYFAGGLYRYRPDTGFQLMTGNVPSSFKAADDGFYGVFPNGVWKWKDGNWTGVTGAIPQTYGVSDTGLFYGDFGGGDGGPDGVWQWSAHTGAWTGVTGADPVHMSVAANGDLHGAFVGGPTGLWKWSAATQTWGQSHPATPVAGAVGVDGSYFADFGPAASGIWRYDGSGWTLLSPALPTKITTRR